MELYILDSLLRRVEVVDKFESLIWAERLTAFGDMELTLPMTAKHAAMFKPKAKLGMSECESGMIVDYALKTTDEDGKRMLKVKGHSFESIFNDRVSASKAAATDAKPRDTWEVKMNPENALREIVKTSLGPLGVTPLEAIALMRPVTERYLPAVNTPIMADVMTFSVQPKPLFETLKEIAEAWDLGFQLVKPHQGGALYFEVIRGNDRTSTQKTREPVIFSQAMGNIRDTSDLHTIEGAKNVAYVTSPAGFQVVYPNEVPPDIDNFDRNAMWVEATDVEAGTVGWEDILKQRGLEALSAQKEMRALDGEVSTSQSYKYGRDYYIGDLVEMRDETGLTNQMRVTEQIFVSDQNGERAYPTLTLANFVTPGSWLSWRSNVTWQQLDPNPMTWAEQP